MIKTIEDLTADLAAACEQVRILTERRNYHDSEKHQAHLELIGADRELDRIVNELLAAQGEPS
ncbi:hypothetical protein J2X63_003215 [Agromyces sp. 3263]|uniref:hypothetical protein n=1 Tax=Agromyces sp. 3263 TaxID=2817750 RepID=UPI002864DA40|nr:hypothetical protein [Agromyces sp. 3263]MDR6907507.1 hypothetical protein [Agromyces sp. 3263]